MSDVITVEALRKVYPTPSAPEGVVALDTLDLTVREGELFGLLGPNGAGKSTTIGILTTRIIPTSGRARVAGFDVVSESTRVRQQIGVVPQRPNPDRNLSTLENLAFHAAYFGLPFAQAERNGRVLLDRLGIGDKADAKVDALSGGQQQRLMIARALIHEPTVIFLDEPTVGLDPQARLDLWEILRDLHAQGRTIIMTTHYMEEADQLCDRIAIVDRGGLLACDTPENLKTLAPDGTIIEVTLDGPADAAADSARHVPGVTRVESHGSALHAYSPRGGEVISALIVAATAVGRTVTNIHLTSPSLESLFISMTGRKLK